MEPAYTQLALNGESGPLADERVRRAVARALNRQELVDTVLGPLGLPAAPLGSHLALAGQPGYQDNSSALGEQDTKKAQALLAEAGWTPGGAAKKKSDGTKAGSKGEKVKGGEHGKGETADKATKADKSDDNKPGDDNKPREDEETSPGHVLAPAPAAAVQSAALLRQADAFTSAVAVADTSTAESSRGKVTGQNRGPGGAAGAYAPMGTAAPAAPAKAADSVRDTLGKDGKPLTLRFVLPSGPGSESLRTVGEKISAMLDSIGIRTEIIKVADAGYFKDHVASGAYDLALYSWPATAYPATDDRPIFAKPVPATDGSLLVEQNYTRVGTDHIDQLFDQALSELDEGAAQDLMKQADARIWAAAASIPLYQRPQLVATDRKLVNVGAFGFGVPHYQDIGFKKQQAAGSPANRKK